MITNKQLTQLPAMQAAITLIGSRIVLDPSRQVAWLTVLWDFRYDPVHCEQERCTKPSRCPSLGHSPHAGTALWICASWLLRWPSHTPQAQILKGVKQLKCAVCSLRNERKETHQVSTSPRNWTHLLLSSSAHGMSSWRIPGSQSGLLRQGDRPMGINAIESCRGSVHYISTRETLVAFMLVIFCNHANSW